MYHVCAGEQQLDDVLRRENPAGCPQGHLGAPEQDRDPAHLQKCFVGLGGIKGGRQAQGIDIDIGLVEAIEQRDAVGAGLVQFACHVGQRTEERRELHVDGQVDVLPEFVQQVEIATFHVGAVLIHVRRHVVDVEFHGVGTRFADLTGAVDPATQGDAVEAGDHGNLQRRLECSDLLEVAVELSREVSVNSWNTGISGCLQSWRVGGVVGGRGLC